MARLFHTLVVCGAGLTLLHCGKGASRPEVDGDTGGVPGSGGAAAGGDDGGEQGGDAGTVAAAGAPASARPAGPTEQWGCDASQIICSSQRFGIDPRKCVRDSTRPEGPDDCPDGTSLVCLKGAIDGDSVLFNCACRDLTEGCACPEVLDSCHARVEAPESCEATSECGCAITCILK